MAPRLELQELFKILTPNVYFQPPPTVVMSYPAIVYERDRVEIEHADNNPYSNKKRYQITVIDRDPDSEIPDMVAKLPTASFERHFTADNLNHDVYNVFF